MQVELQLLRTASDKLREHSNCSKGRGTNQITIFLHVCWSGQLSSWLCRRISILIWSMENVMVEDVYSSMNKSKSKPKLGESSSPKSEVFIFVVRWPASFRTSRTSYLQEGIIPHWDGQGLGQLISRGYTLFASGSTKSRILESNYCGCGWHPMGKLMA